MTRQLKVTIEARQWYPVYVVEECEREEYREPGDKLFNIGKQFLNRYEKAYREWMNVQQELSDRYSREMANDLSKPTT